MSKVLNFQRTSEIDFETGEIKKETIISGINKMVEPPYVKMYIDDLSTLLNIPDAPKNVLTLILKKLDYDGYITLSARYKKEVAEMLGIKVQSVSNNINKLVKAGVIKNAGYGEYKVNPNLFARGDWKTVLEQRLSFDMVVSYSEKGRTIKTVVPPQQELPL